MRQVIETNDDRYCLARNSGDRASSFEHCGREFTLRPGTIVLLKLDEPFFAADGTSRKRFTNVHLPMATLRAMVPDVEELVDASFRPAARCRWRWITATCCCGIRRRSRRRAF